MPRQKGGNRAAPRSRWPDRKAWSSTRCRSRSFLRSPGTTARRPGTRRCCTYRCSSWCRPCKRHHPVCSRPRPARRSRSGSCSNSIPRRRRNSHFVTHSRRCSDRRRLGRRASSNRWPRCTRRRLPHRSHRADAHRLGEADVGARTGTAVVRRDGAEGPQRLAVAASRAARGRGAAFASRATHGAAARSRSLGVAGEVGGVVAARQKQRGDHGGGQRDLAQVSVHYFPRRRPSCARASRWKRPAGYCRR